MNDRERERLEATIARQEDALFSATANILRMRAAIERLASVQPKTAAAVEARKAAAEALRTAVLERRDAGRSIEQTALDLKISTRHVSRLRATDPT